MTRAKNYVTRTACDDAPNRDPDDFYPTPASATRALLAFETFTGPIWEPACGDGAMSEVLLQSGKKVYSSDLFNYGYGETGIDFLGARSPAMNIVTNPPFRHAEAFTFQALRLAQRKVAMLYRLAWLEGQRRYHEIYNVEPPTRTYVFSRRVHFIRGVAQTPGAGGGGGMVAFMWLVWDKSIPATPGRSELIWLPPETKE